MSEKFRSPAGYSRSSVQAASTVKMTAGSLADRLRTPAVQYWLNKTAAVIFTVLAACTLLLE
ncbi:hypothetical protein [Duodenibacillus massiliensis]|uniref:hypothetical protein n=1 Tax=Duodenibacillus massiliensis TaxID=1852381 RepID=UPI003076D9DA